MNARRLFSVEKPGPLGITWQVRDPAGATRSHGTTSSRTISSVSLYQSVANTALSAETAGPVSRAVSSTHSRPSRWFFSLLYPGSTRFWDPMKADLPSTTRIFRWLRRSGRRNCPLKGWTGSISRQSILVPSSRRTRSL